MDTWERYCKKCYPLQQSGARLTIPIMILIILTTTIRLATLGMHRPYMCMVKEKSMTKFLTTLDLNNIILKKEIYDKYETNF